MEIASIDRACMITELPEWKIRYAMADGFISYVNIRGMIVVDVNEIISQKNNGLFAPGSMIKRSLRNSGMWPVNWYDTWEEEEPPMTEIEYEKWVEDKYSKFGQDRTMGAYERAEWRLKGKDY